ncbi:MAG: peptidase [Planctomycetes bacterium]|nr:peptidase [Planctomycetota bacterium]
MLATSRSSHLRLPVIAIAILALCTNNGAATVITMKSGWQVEGRIAEMGSLNENPLNPGTEGGTKPIIIVDDGLRRTFVRDLDVSAVAESPPTSNERIRIKQPVAEAGRRIGNIGPILGVTEFDKWGRRTFTMQGPRGQLDVIQGITEITPTYARVEGLRGTGLIWDMRMATSSLSREIISTVIRQSMPENKPDDRLRIVRLFIQANRFGDALLELDSLIRDFPEVEELRGQADRLRQSLAQRMLREIELRRDAGQHSRAYTLLGAFPEKGVAGVTLLTVRDMLALDEKRQQQLDQSLVLIAENIGEIEDETVKEKLAPIEAEIKDELNFHALDRMADFLRLSDDPSLKPDQKVALAVSGWLLGSGEAIDNLAVAVSLFEVRNEATKYLNAKRTHERDEILERIRSLEGGSPSYLARLIAQMKPPIATEVPELESPGLYQLTVPGIQQQPEFSYYIQLPPEYDPYRRYPCIVTLNGAGSTEMQQIDWWAGTYSDQSQTRQGQAARHGYIVIAPMWQKEFQREYEFTLREHATVLYALRDACQRASIDTDRVFLSGHSMGGDAAWDIGLSHPDLWAGVIPIVANADRYIHKYSDNGRGLPMYFVGGERDGGWLNENGMELDRYLKGSKYDVTVVQYLGRGHEHFQDEIQRLFDWMELSSHRREFFPREIEALSMRPWDNYFWWLELSQIPARALALPAEGKERTVRPIKTAARILENNRITVSARSGRGVVWLSPEMVDFEQPITVTVNGRNIRKDAATDVKTLLEDVRTRGDRQHPFWASVEWPANR